MVTTQDHFNYLVTHNAMKWGPCEKREGVFSYEPADGAVAWAKVQGLPMRGHALLWATGDRGNFNLLPVKAPRYPTGWTTTLGPSWPLLWRRGSMMP